MCWQLKPGNDRFICKYLFRELQGVTVHHGHHASRRLSLSALSAGRAVIHGRCPLPCRLHVPPMGARPVMFSPPLHRVASSIIRTCSAAGNVPAQHGREGRPLLAYANQRYHQRLHPVLVARPADCSAPHDLHSTPSVSFVITQRTRGSHRSALTYLLTYRLVGFG